MQPASRLTRQYGFTLLEISVVLVIIAIVLGSGVTMLTAATQKRQLQETQFKMQAIQQALLDYRRANNRIPCPADVTLPVANVNFGMEAGSIAPGLGNCIGGTPTANYPVPPATASNSEGLVPTQALRLPDDYAFDGWGRRINYAVNNSLTAINGFSAMSISSPSPMMTVKDTASNPKSITTQAAYVLTSFGPNGHGATPHGGGTALVNAGSTNADELQNCSCTSAGVYNAFTGLFVQKPATIDPANQYNAFDDIVSFGTRATLRSYSDMSAPLPSPTFSINQGGFETPSGISYAYAPSGSAWTFSGGGISGNNSPFTSGNPNAPEGVQVAFCQGSCMISQSISMNAGNYTISIMTAIRPCCGGSGETINILVDGAIVGSVVPTWNAYASYTSNVFSVTAGTHSIAFNGVNASGDTTVFIDNAQLTTQ